MAVYEPISTALTEAAQSEGGAHVDTAEALLDAALAERGYGKLTEAGLTEGSDEHTRARLAVTHQVNYLVEAGADGEVYGSQRRGDRQASFRGASSFPTVSPRAFAIARTLVTAPSSSTWPAAGGLR